MKLIVLALIFQFWNRHRLAFNNSSCWAEGNLRFQSLIGLKTGGIPR